MNDFDKQEINERLDLAIKVVESYNRDISSFVSGDLFAYISDNLDGVDVASVNYYLKERYAEQYEAIADLEDAMQREDGQDFDDDFDTKKNLELMDNANRYEVPMVDLWELYPDREVKQVTTHDIIKYLESRKY